MAPRLIVPRLPPTMGDDESLDTGSAHRTTDSSQVIEKSDLDRYFFDTRPDFPSFRKKVVVGIDNQ